MERFSIGELVRHREHGVGVITDRGADSSVLVGFDSGVTTELGLNVAERALMALPMDGLIAQNRADPAVCREWSTQSVLHLVAASLRDLGNEGALADIRGSIVFSGAIVGSWDAWWKRAQKAVASSRAFQIKGRMINLNDSFVGSLPHVALPEPVRTTAEPIDQASLAALATAIITGDDVSIEPPLSNAALKLVIKNLRVQSELGALANPTLVTQLAPDARRLATLLTALMRADELRAALDVVGHICGELLGALVPNSHSELSEAPRQDWLDARVALVGNYQKQFLTKPPPPALAFADSWGVIIGAYAHFESRDQFPQDRAIASALGALLVAYIQQFGATAIDLVLRWAETQRGATNLATSTIASLAGLLPSPLDGMFISRALASSPTVAGVAASKFLRAQPPELAISFVNAQLDLRSELTIESVGTLSQLLLSLDEWTPSAFSLDLVNVAVRLDALATDDMANQISAIVPKRISHLFNNRKGVAQSVDPGDRVLTSKRSLLLMAAISAHHEHVAGLNRSRARSEAKLRERIATSESDLTEALTEQARISRMLEELRSGFRSPERWVAFRAKVEALQQITNAIQEAQNAQAQVTTAAVFLDLPLARLGAVQFATEGEVVEFDAALHHQQSEGSRFSKTVRVITPGFKVLDPEGGAVILTRALVIPEEESHGT